MPLNIFHIVFNIGVQKCFFQIEQTLFIAFGFFCFQKNENGQNNVFSAVKYKSKSL